MNRLLKAILIIMFIVGGLTYQTNAWAVTESLAIIYPGETVLNPGTKYYIQFVGQLSSSSVRVDIVNSLGTVTPIAYSVPVQNNVVIKCPWTVPTTFVDKTKYRIKITSNGWKNVWYGSYFTIHRPKVIYPSGNYIQLQTGIPQKIEWVGFKTSAVKIELYKSGAYYKTIGATVPNNIDSVSNIISWTIPSDCPEGNLYKIKVSNSKQSDLSDYNFYITKPVVTSPTSGQTLKEGSKYSIKWDFKNSSNIKIELYWRDITIIDSNYVLYSTIISSTENDGIYTWLVPTNIPCPTFWIGPELWPVYKWKVRCVATDGRYAYSPEFWIIK